MSLADARRRKLQSSEDVQAWIIGIDIATLAAAVYLLEDAQLPAENIHLLNVHKGCGMEVQSSGDPKHGYVLKTGGLPFFRGYCVDRLLSRVSSPESSLKSSLEVYPESKKKLQNHCMKAARLLKTMGLRSHPKRLTLENCFINLKHRYELLRLVVGSERSLQGKSIKDIFSNSFFDSNIWRVWSTT
jgi:oleate hydratase